MSESIKATSRYGGVRALALGLAATALVLGGRGGGSGARSQSVGSAGQATSERTPTTTAEPAKGAETGMPGTVDLSAGLVGSASCRECHPGESALHSRSGHARTLRPAASTAVARWLDGRKVEDPERPGATWTYAIAHGTLEAEHAEKGRYHCIPLDLAVGSGTNGMTFVTLGAPAFEGGPLTGREHRLSFLETSKAMEVTPGQGKDDSMSHRRGINELGRSLESYELAKCLGCHATLTSRSNPIELDRAALIPNVGCERCHGPGAEHIAAARRGDPDEKLIMTLGAADRAGSAVHQIVLCGQCHRNADNVGSSQMSEDNAEIARFQPLGLELSKCFQRGKSGLSCVSCHDPHAKVEEGPARYENVCKSCHSPALKTVCPVNTTDGCIQCHMPERPVSVVFRFTDHWIRKPKAKKPAGKP
ncbi:MAG: multiheme c-type cytochrome [Isosphaeraceae bacterium]